MPTWILLATLCTASGCDETEVARWSSWTRGCVQGAFDFLVADNNFKKYRSLRCELTFSDKRS